MGSETQSPWLEGRWASSVNPEAKRVNSLYADCQVRTVAKTGRAVLKAPLLHTSVINTEQLRERHCARDCRRDPDEQGRFSVF